MCETYGVELSERDIKEVVEIADDAGEVSNYVPISFLFCNLIFNRQTLVCSVTKNWSQAVRSFFWIPNSCAIENLSLKTFSFS